MPLDLARQDLPGNVTHQMGRPLLRGSLALSTLLLVPACSSSTDERQPITSTPEDYCQRACDQAHACKDTTNSAECSSACRSALAVEPKLRADLLGYVASCIENSSCASTSTVKCTQEAQAQLSPSSFGKSFCTAFLAAGTQCDTSGATYPESTCFEAAKSYDDSALKAAQDCLAKSCSELSACLAQAIPDVMLLP